MARTEESKGEPSATLHEEAEFYKGVNHMLTADEFETAGGMLYNLRKNDPDI